MDKFRLDSGVKKIEVNDDGEYISINLSDSVFFDRFNNFIKWFNEKQVEAENRCNEISAKYEENSAEDEGFNFEEFSDTTKLYKELCENTCAELEKLFGDGCVRKVFPDVELPGFELIISFLDAITPLLQKYAKERNEKINTRYNRNRKGARKK